ncbi:heme-degrading domain-containing protein [Rouxiella badensis]|uniref:heme-degrading domain-containing protein n=1 Tax=Rouxiella badensis TaxID=1646377 RepID=UPI001B7971A5|nr:heme-degrading domain-containing protein [Rouxiella badensis]MCC3746544.1 heme-degrading domain-containing protein [Rouxiella badensis]
MSHTLTPEILLQQEAEHRFDNLDFDFTSAWEIGSAIRQRALESDAPVSIEVFAFGQPLFLTALPGSSADNLEWMKRKRNTVLRLAHSSLYAGLNYELTGERMEHHAFINQAEYCDHGGSFPLLTRAGGVFGAVSVSGLPSQDDHALVVYGISHYLKHKK